MINNFITNFFWIGVFIYVNGLVKITFVGLVAKGISLFFVSGGALGSAVTTSVPPITSAALCKKADSSVSNLAGRFKIVLIVSTNFRPCSFFISKWNIF